MLTAGVARRIINPSLDVPHAGWGAQTHIEADSIEADLWTTAAVIGDDKMTAAVLIDVDTSHFSLAQADEIRRQVAERTGFALACVRVSTTHTHSGPMLLSEYYPNHREAIDAYFAHICSATVEAAAEAADQRVAVTVHAGNGECRIGRNRRQRLEDGRMVVGYNPDGITDPIVGAIRFDDTHGHTLLSIVHYACHPTMLGFDNKLFSPEYPGVTKRVVEKLIGGTCLFLQGAAGNIGPGPEGFQTNVAAMKRIGTVLGYEAAKVLTELAAPAAEFRFDRVVESGAPLGLWRELPRTLASLEFEVRSVPVRLPLQTQLSVEEAAVRANGLTQELERLQRSGASGERIREITFQAKRAYFALRRSELYFGKSELNVEAHIVRIGDIALVGLPVEIFNETGLVVREGSPFAHTLVSGYANGWQGYLPTRADYPLGGYEVDTTPFAPGADERLADALIAALCEMKHDD
ncbi:neutral/alkaline non-lysosomal ceramidase N-terminal domain-containing protein [Paenibacillus eucommiae]|uniref:Plasmid stabilization system protein ParE n=1 Tax=Paenibacillus eucommiae TaxID=1355755 RepID=A0ABS4J635_9BACL|nr:neutral/alkaline non-lysosomal ceramidase N-terminal domain-containing protein [Paenibacillus eucommiae]MBP1995316.1 plasmid stabilization system protein ParE [Paenibacillus eucommiae]